MSQDPGPRHVCARHEVVPKALRAFLHWDGRHDRMASLAMREFGLRLPGDRELIRQLAFVWVAQGPPKDRSSATSTAVA